MPNVNVTYEEIRDAARRLSTGQTDIESKLAELQGLVTSLVNGGYVTDASSREFETAYNRFNVGAKNVIGGLADMGTYLTAAANAFEGADKDLAARLRSS